MSRDTYGKLGHLKSGGSTSRVIDLVSVHEKFGQTSGYHNAPLFQMRRLNRSFIVKHTLRAWERESLGGGRISATKIIIPISETDLSIGGHSVFVEDMHMVDHLSEHLGVSKASKPFIADVERLRSLALLPSFDPYLLHENFRLLNEHVDECYFTIGDKELSSISEFVAGQINLLVKKAMSGLGKSSMTQSKRLASILFEDHNSPKLSVLRDALRMSDDEYREGVFGWKGTLYYCWRAGACHNDLIDFMKNLRVVDLDAMSASDRNDIKQVMQSVGLLASQRWNRLQEQLNGYHEEFSYFVERGDPASLKSFLIRAPDLFVEMGEDISRLQHVSSFWRFWTRGQGLKAMTPQEIFDLLNDFEAALTKTDTPEAA